MKRGFATAALVNPANFGRGLRDCVPRLRLTDLPGFGSKLARMSARQLLLVQPQMNHFVLQDFNKSLLGRIAQNAAHLERRAVLPDINE